MPAARRARAGAGSWPEPLVADVRRRASATWTSRSSARSAESVPRADVRPGARRRASSHEPFTPRHRRSSPPPLPPSSSRSPRATGHSASVQPGRGPHRRLHRLRARRGHRRRQAGPSAGDAAVLPPARCSDGGLAHRARRPRSARAPPCSRRRSRSPDAAPWPPRAAWTSRGSPPRALAVLGGTGDFVGAAGTVDVDSGKQRARSPSR